MELQKQNGLPGVVNHFSLIAAAGKTCERGQPFRLAELKFHLAVHPLVAGLRSIGAAVVFQIQFAVPDGDFLRGVFHILMELAEEIVRAACLYMRKAGNLVQNAAHFQHIAVRAAASVAMAVGDQRIAREIFILEFFPASKRGDRGDHSVIGRAAPVKRLRGVRRFDEVG